MKPIRIIDRDFNLLGEIDDYESLIWTRRWHKAGEFKLYININKQNTYTLQKENIVLFDGKASIIRHREIVIDESGKGGETLLIIGSSLSSLVGRRITIPPAGKAYDIINSDSETVIKHYVDINCINPVDIKRKIPNLVIADNKNRGANLKYQSRLKQLDEELEKISITSGLGWAISIDIENKQFVFDVMEGKDLTSNQTRNNPVIFSIDFDNVKGQTYIDSDLNYRNQAYVGGQGEGVDRSIVEVGNTQQGLDRHEVFIDARDIENDLDLPARGQQKLLEMQQLQSFESEIMTKGTFEYKKDWDLGDIVTVINPKWGITMETRIIEVTETYEPGGFKLEATFGNTIPTLVDKIKRDLDIPLIEKGEGGGVNSWKDIEDKPEEYPPNEHEHSWNEIIDRPTKPILDDNLVLYLDASKYVEGSSWNDLSGNNNHGMLENFSHDNINGWIFGNRIRFDENSLCNVKCPMIGFDEDSDFTIELVVNSSKWISAYPLLNKTDRNSSIWNSVGMGFSNIYNPHWLYFMINDGSGYKSVRITPTETYDTSHIVVKKEGNLLKTYFNFNYNNQLDISGYGSFKTNNDLIISRGYCSEIFILRIYNRDLSDEEILQNYNYEKARLGL